MILIKSNVSWENYRMSIKANTNLSEDFISWWYHAVSLFKVWIHVFLQHSAFVSQHGHAFFTFKMTWFL